MVTFEQYNEWRERLLILIGRAVKAAEKLQLSEKATVFSHLQDQLKNDTLKIQVVGSVKNGKSSFTNALVGESILPVDDLPCTAVVSEVKYGLNQKAVIHFRSPLPMGLIDEIPDATRLYIEKHNYGKDASGNDFVIPPLEIPYNQLNKYVVIPSFSMEIYADPDKLNSFMERYGEESPYAKAELFHSANLLKDGVEFIDSPGLHESEARTKVTMGYLKEADAAIFLFDAAKPFTSTERDDIELLRYYGFKDLVFVVNRIDLVGNREAMRAFIEAQAAPYSSNPHVYAVSAKEALDAMEKKDDGLLVQSGMPEFKDYLENYLTKTKGRIKLSKPANYLNNSITNDIVGKVIPERLAALEVDANELRQRLNTATPILTDLQAKRERMANKLDQNIKIAIIPIKACINEFFNKLDDKITEWLDAFEPTTSFARLMLNSGRRKLAEETLKYIQGKFKTEYDNWEKETFRKFVVTQANTAFGDLEENIESMAEDLTTIENILKGMRPDGVSDISALERIAGLTAMLFLPMGRAGGEVLTGGFNLANFFKTFAVDLGVGLGVGMLALFVWHPLGWIAAIAGAIWGMIRGGNKAKDAIIARIGEEVKKKIKEKAELQTNEIIKKVRSTFEELRDSVLKSVDTEIAGVEVQIKEIRSITENEQNSIDNKRMLLDDTKEELVKVSEELGKLMAEVDVAN